MTAEFVRPDSSREGLDERHNPQVLPGLGRLASAGLDPTRPEQWAEGYLNELRQFAAMDDGGGWTEHISEIRLSNMLVSELTRPKQDTADGISLSSGGLLPGGRSTAETPTGTTGGADQESINYIGYDGPTPDSEQFLPGLYSNIIRLIAASRAAYKKDGKIEAIEAMTFEQQMQVVSAFYSEWIELHDIAAAAGTKTSYYTFRMPLTRNSLDALKAELDDNDSGLSPATIVSLFFNHSRTFHQACDEERKKLSAGPPPRLKTNREIELDNNTNKLLANTRYKKFITERTELDPLFIDKLTDIDDIIQAMCGQFAREIAVEFGEATHNVWGAGVTKELYELVKPKDFWGKLSNTRLVHLPVDDKYTERYIRRFKKSDTRRVRKDNEHRILARIGVFTDMNSTGKGKVGESFQDIVIYARDTKDPELRQIDLNVSKNVHGDKVMRYLGAGPGSQEDFERIRSLRNPISGDSPASQNR